MKAFSRIILYLFIFLIIFGGINLLISSFQESYPWPKIIEGTYGIRAYKYIKNDNKVKIGMKNSFIIGIAATFLSVLLAYPLAKKLKMVKTKKLLSAIVFLPFVIGGTSVGFGLQQIFLKMGLAGTTFGIIFVQLAYIIPYAVWILLPGFEYISEDKIFAAKMLGAGSGAIVRDIIIPTMSPFILTALSMGFILSFSQYYLTVIIGIGLVETYSTVIFPFIIVKDRALSSAMSLIFVALNLIFILIIQFILGVIKRRKRWKI